MVPERLSSVLRASALSAALALGLAAGAAHAREIPIRPGAAGKPVIANAIAAAQPGDVIHLGPGVYPECVALTTGVTLEGETGTVLDPSQRFRVDWHPALDIGPGVYRAAVEHRPPTLFLGGLRYKLPRIGPIFIYRNVFVDGAPNNIWYSMDDSLAEGYVYHNTIIGGSVGLSYGVYETPHHLGQPHWHYLNNLIIDPQGFFVNHGAAAPVNFFSDYNVIVGGNRPYPHDPSKDSHSRYVDRVPLSPGFPPVPLPGSAAIGAGLDLSTYYHGKPLPGCEPGYFSGSAPNAGAY